MKSSKAVLSRIIWMSIMSIMSFFIVFWGSSAVANMQGDIDGNGVIDLKDCLAIIQILANPAIPFEIVQAKPVINGTYSQTTQSGKTSYTFNEDGTCSRVGPDDIGGKITTTGTWRYENNNLHIITTGDTQVFVLKLNITIDELYENAFTNPDGSKLILVPPGKPMKDFPDLIGTYKGAANAKVNIKDMSNWDKSIVIETSLTVGYDGSWESVITIKTNDTPKVTTYSGKNDSKKPIIYVFGDYYFPDIFSSENKEVYYERE